MSKVSIVLLFLFLFPVANAITFIDFRDDYQDYLGNWYKIDKLNISIHPWYLKTENSTNYILQRMDDNLILNKSFVYNGSWGFGLTDISFTIIAPASKIQNISTANGTGQRRIKIPESTVQTYKQFTWDNKLPVVFLKNDTWNMVVMQSDYWYSRQNGDLWFNFKTVNVTGLAADVNVSFYFTSWIINNATTSGWTNNTVMNGSAWSGYGGGSLVLNWRNDSQLNVFNNSVAIYRCDEESGNQIHNQNDESGLINSTYPGTFNGNATLNYTASPNGNACKFDGTKDSVGLGSLNISNGTTILTRIKHDGLGGNQAYLVSSDATGWFVPIELSYISATSSIRVLVANTNPFYREWQAPATLSTGVNYSIIMTQTSPTTKPRIFLNGAELTVNAIADTGGNPGRSPAQDTDIGKYGSINSYFMNGAEDDVSIWNNRVMSSAEVSVLANNSMRSRAMPILYNRTASGNVINRFRITYGGGDSLTNVSFYLKQNNSALPFSLVQSNPNSGQWYNIQSAYQFTSIDIGLLMQSNGSKTVLISSVELDGIATIGNLSNERRLRMTQIKNLTDYLLGGFLPYYNGTSMINSPLSTDGTNVTYKGNELATTNQIVVGAVTNATVNFYTGNASNLSTGTIVYANNNVTGLRLLNTQYTNSNTKSMEVFATARVQISIAGGSGVFYGNVSGINASGKVGIESGLLNQESTQQLTFIVCPSCNYAINSSVNNAVITLEDVREVLI